MNKQNRKKNELSNERTNESTKLPKKRKKDDETAKIKTKNYTKKNLQNYWEAKFLKSVKKQTNKQTQMKKNEYEIKTTEKKPID